MIHLIDALPYVFRAYFSLPSSLVDAEGRPANAVRGFADFLARYVSEERPTHLAIAFDRSLVSSFRNDEYPAYKSSRELPEPELEAQLAACEELAAAIGAPVFVDERYEADDLIATIARRVRAEARGVVVVTNDKDLAQLVDDGTTWFDFAKGARLDAQGVIEKMGVRPDQIPDFLGLAGDAVDDIPGVKGIGKTSAQRLLARYDDLDAIYADLEGVAALEIRGAKSIAAKLDAGRELAFLSRRLATVAYDAPVEGEGRNLIDRLQYGGPDAERLAPLLERFGVSRLLPRFLDR